MPQAFCLAAGLGKRLRPVTNHIPKPLFPVCGEPNLKRIIQTLFTYGFERIVVNAHHLLGSIEEFISAHFPNVSLSKEESLLGTGGGLKQASLYLDSDSPILIINSDIVFDFPLDVLIKYHREKGGVATLLLTDFGPSNLVTVEGERVLGFSREIRPSGLCFTGISIVEPRFHTYCPDRIPFSLIEIFEAAISAGERLSYLIGEEAHPGFFWQDIGTPDGYIMAHELLITGTSGQSWNWIGKGAVIPKGTNLDQCIVWDNALVPAGGPFKRVVFTPFGVLEASEKGYH